MGRGTGVLAECVGEELKSRSFTFRVRSIVRERETPSPFSDAPIGLGQRELRQLHYLSTLHRRLADGCRRKQIPFTLTHESLAKLAHDLTGA